MARHSQRFKRGAVKFITVGSLRDPGGSGSVAPIKIELSASILYCMDGGLQVREIDDVRVASNREQQ